jgi:peptidoglycan/LPS O-acetylase OafA/YrhL
MKINQLTFFRFLAAALVVVFHFGREVAPFNTPTGLLFVEHLSSLVSFFFLLSGFVLAVSSFRKPDFSRKEFYRNRFVRIYPLYVFALLVFFLPALLDGVWWQNLDLKHFAMNLTLTQSVFADNALTLNYPGWSLSVELCFYLLFPLLFSFLHKRSSDFLIGGALMFWGLTQLAYIISMEVLQVNGNFTMYFPAYHLSTFVLGVSAGLIFCRHREVLERLRPWLIAAVLGLGGGSVALILTQNPVLKYHHSGLFNPLFLAVVLLFSLDRAPFKKILSSRPLVLLGEISYGIYILQYAVWCLLYNIAGSFGIPQLTQFYVAFTVLLLSSALFYYMVEMPPVNFVKAWSRRPVTAPVADHVVLLPRGYGFNHAISGRGRG